MTQLETAIVTQIDGLRQDLKLSQQFPARIGDDFLKQGDPKPRQGSTDDFSSSSTVVSFTGIQHGNGLHRCKDECPCQCHVRSNIKTPSWLRAVVSSLFISYTGSPLWARPSCNYPPCKDTTGQAASYTYHFPRWMVTRSVCLSLVQHNLGGLGGSWALSIPKVLDGGDPVWRFVNYGTVPQLADIQGRKVVAPCDMNQDRKSRLHVLTP